MTNTVDNSSNTALAPSVSPLTEADPDSINLLIKERINELFNKRPKQVTDEDLTIMVQYYRKERGRYILEAAAKPPRAKAGTAKAVKLAAKPTSIADVTNTFDKAAEDFF